jgi:WD40 repeat protein
MTVPVDHGDRATVAERSGAAGRALECRFEPYAGGSGDYVDSGLESVQEDPHAALQNWLTEEFVQLPHDGYRVEREDDGRVLLSYDVDGETKIAVITADGITDWNGDEGWGVETWAQCDPAELPTEVSDELGIGVWHTPSGKPVPVTRIHSTAGPEHCDWQDIVFLTLGGEQRDHLFLRDTTDKLQQWLATTYDGRAALPQDASDSGFERDGRHLWLARDGTAAYLVSTDDPNDVERWPAEKEPIGCD